jgi:hypothetical protein
MDYRDWAYLLKPIFGVLFIAAIVIPVRYGMRFFPQGKLKTFLTRKL